MQELLPVAKANAVAAAGFGVIMAVLNKTPFGQNTMVLLGVTILYVFVMNRWVTRVVPPMPSAQAKERKGSFKADKTPPKTSKWDVAKWTLKVMAVGVVAQMLVFTVVWMLLMFLLPTFF